MQCYNQQRQSHMLQDFNWEVFISAQESRYVIVSNPAPERAVLSKELVYEQTANADH